MNCTTGADREATIRKPIVYSLFRPSWAHQVQKRHSSFSITCADNQHLKVKARILSLPEIEARLCATEPRAS